MPSEFSWRERYGPKNAEPPIPTGGSCSHPQAYEEFMLLALCLRTLPRFALCQLLLIILFGQELRIDVRCGHVVHAALPPANPDRRIRIPAIARGIVVDGNQMQHRARREERRDIVGVGVHDV